MQARLFLDLDGVMADFDAAFPSVFGLNHRDMADKEMWGHINGHPTFFLDLPPCPGALEFYHDIRHLQPVVLTACNASNYVNVARQKREWVRRHLGRDVTVLPVSGGVHKPLFMHARGDILIDDFRRNTEAWEMAGGRAILHRSWGVTRSALTNMVLAGRAAA